jgi:hypothetical protein
MQRLLNKVQKTIARKHNSTGSARRIDAPQSPKLYYS